MFRCLRRIWHGFRLVSAAALAVILGSPQSYADPLYSVTAITVGFITYGDALNDVGQVAGSISNPTATTAAIWSNGTVSSLGTLGGRFSLAYGINDSGQVVGYAFLPGSVSHAFLYSNGAMIDLNTLIDPSQNIILSFALSINNVGQILAENTKSSYYLLTPTSVPEPSAWLLCAGGLMTSAAIRYGRRQTGREKRLITRRTQLLT